MPMMVVGVVVGVRVLGCRWVEHMLWRDKKTKVDESTKFNLL